jgi:hypothetical protein
VQSTEEAPETVREKRVTATEINPGYFCKLIEKQQSMRKQPKK